MELPINPEQKGENSNKTPVIYTACGWVAGVFKPQKKKKKKLQGVLLTQDGQEIRAIIDWYVLRRIKKQMQQDFCLAEFLQAVHQWKVYPRTQPLRFDIVKIRAQPYEEQKQAKNSHPLELDKFRVVGEIKYIAKGKVVMRIERNEQVPNRSNNHHPVHLELAGSIPTGEIGQIWELQVRRCGMKLRIEQAKVYQPSDREIRLFNLLNSQKMASQKSIVDAPALEPEIERSRVSTTIDRHSSSAKEQDLQSEETKLKLCQETAKNLRKAQSQSASTLSQGDGNGRSKNKSAPSLAGNGARPQQQQSRFTVQINGQVFIGQNSVTLNRRVLNIDGKPVAQSKLAVVVGQPKMMQADGTVTSSGERSVLISR